MNPAQPGFTKSVSLSAMTLKQRILNGETIPLSELKEFILLAETDLASTKPKPPKPPPSQDIDFF